MLGCCSRRSPPCLRLPDTCCGYDIDDAFPYDFPKTIRIRDATLGLMYYCFLFMTIVYIFVYQILYGLNYLKFRAPTATFRLTMQQPVVDGCNPNDDGCQDNFPQIDSLDYCCTSACPRNPTGGGCSCPWRKYTNYDCVYFDGPDASVVTASSIMVTSVEKDYIQVRNSSCGHAGCSKLWNYDSPPTPHFVAGIENFTIMVDHSAAQQELGIYVTSRTTRGYLHVGGTDELQQKLCHDDPTAVTSPMGESRTNKAPCYIRPGAVTNDTLDIFRVSTVLSAMGVSLESASYSGSNHSMRYEGLTATLYVDYYNTWPWHLPLGTVSYVYSLEAQTTAPYKVSEIVWTEYPDKRVKRDLHGMFLSVKPAGQLAVFDFQTMLVTLTTSLALLAVADTAVRYVALNVMKLRPYYQHLLYQVSVDFSDVRDMEALSDQELDARLQERNLYSGGSREEQILRILEDDEARTRTHTRPASSASEIGPIAEQLLGSHASGGHEARAVAASGAGRRNAADADRSSAAEIE
eukprot:TRINITY_DN70975_c0_g1_i1.p1 TRINITY_DN70975_c0_g1~~TRINITY_DN70975_c0_g1_i1.p1  ORF type:complete len:520 (+),score=89.29 TRINITY_DN70975_c0_g1_i1:227-1786(+)